MESVGVGKTSCFFFPEKVFEPYQDCALILASAFHLVLYSAFLNSLLLIFRRSWFFVSLRKKPAFIHKSGLQSLNVKIVFSTKYYEYLFPEFLTLTERYEVTTLRSKLCASVKEINHNREDRSRTLCWCWRISNQIYSQWILALVSHWSVCKGRKIY